MERMDITVKAYAKVNKAARQIIDNPETEIEYIRRAKNGDIAARNLLLEAQLLGLYSISLKRNFQSYRGDASEMVDAVAIRFDEIISKFDETRGVRFFTHLLNWARSEMGTELMADRPGIRVPANIFKEGRANEVAACISGNDTLGDDSELSVFDCVADPQVDVYEEAAAMEQHRMVDRYMAVLSDLERTVIRKIFFDCHAMTDVAKSIGTTKESVRSIRDGAIRKMQMIAKAELNYTFDAFPHL